MVPDTLSDKPRVQQGSWKVSPSMNHMGVLIAFHGCRSNREQGGLQELWIDDRYVCGEKKKGNVDKLDVAMKGMTVD
jgi:hypothetical protein